VEATALLMKALELKPTDTDTWNTLGVLLVRQGETAQGIDAFGRALRLYPDHPEAHRNLAVALDRQGRSREAAIHYRAFLRLSAESDPARDDVRRRLIEVSVSGAEGQAPWRGAAEGEPRDPSPDSAMPSRASASGNRSGVSGPE
jgi:Flp pilus assembly protein TadD